MLHPKTNTLVQDKLILQPEQGKVLSLLGNTVIIKLSGADSNGQLTVIEYHLAADGPCPPPHRHAYGEVFYMLEGEITFQIEGRTVVGAAGTTVIVPAGVVHSYTNDSGKQARYLVVCSPAGLDGYFEELADIIRAEPTWPPRDMNQLIALNKKYDTEVVVPANKLN